MKNGFGFISMILTVTIGALTLVSNFVDKKNTEHIIQEQVEKAVAKRLNT